MRLNNRYTLKDIEGKEQIRHKFLWFPKRFGKEPETRWLERAAIVYQVKKVDMGGFDKDFIWKWRPVRFATAADWATLPIRKSPKRNKNQAVWLFLDSLFLATIVSIDANPVFFIFILLKIIQILLYLLKRDETDAL